jgi:repressor LexA|nr:MAG TPA: Repressor protein CI [Caudoviricetes sp.]
MKISTFAQRLRAGLDARQMTQAELSSRSKISKSSISHYLKGDWEGKQDAVYSIAQVLNVSEAWLMGYDVPMDAEHATPSQPAQKATIPPGFEPMPEMDMVPLVGRIACGTPITAEQNVERIVCVPSKWRSTFTLTCKGDSMEPRIHDGDLVAIRKQPEVENGEIAAVRIGEEATLKHVYLHENFIELRPENPAFNSIILSREDMNDVVIEGKAVGLCRDI